MIKLTIKQFKKKLIRGLANPELFKLPVKDNVDEYEPMIIKVLVTDTDNKMTINICHSSSIIGFSYPYYSYIDMEEEYANNNKIQISPLQGKIQFKHSVSAFYYNFKIKDSSKVLVTDDIDYFRDSTDCLYKSHDEDVTSVIYSKFCSKESPWCEVDWGDGTVENCSIEHFDNDSSPFSFDYIKRNSDMIHTYENTGEYYIKIRGRIPTLSFYKTFGKTTNYNIELQEVVQWGNLHLYIIDNLFSHQWHNPAKFKMPTHIPSYSFKNVVSAYRAFYNCALDETEFSQEIIFKFVNIFPDLLLGAGLFEKTNISYIPQYFCYNHKNIISCQNMFDSCPITRIEKYAFANCNVLSDVFDLVYNNTSYQPLPLLTEVDDSVFENDINLLRMDYAFNYIDLSGYSYSDLYTNDNLGLKTVGNNIFKNCKRLRFANEPFYQQAGLVSVGDSLFEGCEDLVSVKMCFYRCYSIEKIGDNIFKGCAKIRNCRDFCYENYLVNFPDKMFYDLKYFEYLKGLSDYGNFNGYWATLEEDSGQIIDNGNLPRFLKFKGYNHNNFPIRKHSKDLFSKEYLTDCIIHGDVIFQYSSNGIFDSIIQFRNVKSEHYYDNYIISNFTEVAFPLWEIQNFKSLFKDFNRYGSIFGIRNIKIQYIYKHEISSGYFMEYGTTINYYDNYADIAKAAPIICRIQPNGHFIYTEIGFLNMHHSPIEYDTDSETYKVLEFNDAIEYEYIE